MALAKGKSKWLALAVVVIIPLMVTLDGTVVNVAMPVMAKDLSVTLEQVQTVVTYYLLAVVGSILLFGRLGDILGKGRVFLFGIAIFGLGSLLAYFSHSLLLLNIARLVEGVGGAAAMANNQGIITEVFPENERGKALGISGVFAALGTTLGPPIGGLIVTNFRWNDIFVINVPIALIAIVAGLKLLPKGARTKAKVDIAGAVLMAGAVSFFFIALLRGERHGYTDPQVLLGLAGSVALLATFFVVEMKVKTPVLELSLFKNGLFSISILCVLILFIVSGGVAILMPIYLEDLRRMTAAESGLLLMALPIAMAITSPISGTLSDKVGPAPLTVVGLGVTLVGMMMLSTIGATTPVWIMAAYLALVGAGSGFFAAPNTSLIMGTAPKDKLGIAGSINGFMRNFGSAVGVSAFTSILYALMAARAGHPVSGFVPGKPEYFLSAMQVVYRVAVGLLALGMVLTILRLLKENKLKKTAH